MSFRLSELAAYIGAEVKGDPERQVDRLSTLASAGPRDLSFLTDHRYRRLASESGAGAIVTTGDIEGLAVDQLVCDDPGLAMVQLLEILHPVERPVPGVHPTAVIGQRCNIDDTASLGAYVVVGEDCEIGARCDLQAHVTLGSGSKLEEAVVLYPHVCLYAGTVLGAGVVVHSGAVLGSDGHGYLWRDGRYAKVPQVGTVVVEEDVEIGANSTVDRATLEVTRIGRGSKIDNLVQVGHNVSLGEDCMICAQVGVAGSATVGDRVVMAGQSGIADHCHVGDGVQIGAKSAVLRDAEAGMVLGGTPAIEASKWRRQFVMLNRLEEMNRRLRALEKELLELRNGES